VAAKTREASAGSLRSGVFDQIVQRAVVQVKSDSGEIRIDLKPDFLGHVRMQIVTENQQVTVRILTERPVVRDMIEANLHQLKSELQSQGLQVQRVEVAVADDPREHPYRQAKKGGSNKRVDVGGVAASDRPAPAIRSETPYDRSRVGRQAAVDMFV
jgi:flagellar hook-length control protein FliK